MIHNDRGNILYNGQMPNYYMVHAAEIVTEVFVAEALTALQEISRKNGTEFLACQYSKLWYLASAARGGPRIPLHQSRFSLSSF